MTVIENHRSPARVEAVVVPAPPAMVDAHLLERSGFRQGELIGGKYEVRGLIGEGGMGIVLSAYHVDLARPVAIKVVRNELLRDDEIVDRLLAEAQIAACIRSEHVTRVLDVGRLASGAPYIVFEYLEGRDLGGLLDQNGPLETDVAVDFVLQVCDALAEAHAGGIVHRDLKPENLFFTRRPDGSPVIKVLDFGISKNLTQSERSSAGANQVCGSPYYMAPEQIRDTVSDVRSDIWALGVVLYELCTGQTPFAADSVSSVCQLVLNESPTPPRTFAADLPEALEAVILRCLSKNVDERYANVAELAAAIAPFGGPEASYYAERVERVLAGVPVSLPLSSPRPVSGRRLNRLPPLVQHPDVRIIVDDTRADFATQPSLEPSVVRRAKPRRRVNRAVRACLRALRSKHRRRRLRRHRSAKGLLVGLLIGATTAIAFVWVLALAGGDDDAGTLRQERARALLDPKPAPAASAVGATTMITIGEPLTELEAGAPEPVPASAPKVRSGAPLDPWDRRSFGGRR